MSRATIIDGRKQGKAEGTDTHIHNQWYEDGDGDLFCWSGEDGKYTVVRGVSSRVSGAVHNLKNPAIRGTLVPVNITITITD